MIYFRNQADVINSLRKAIKDGLNIAVYGDYDVDGLFSLMVFKDMFRFIGYRKKVYLYASTDRHTP